MASVFVGSPTGVDLTGVDWVFSAPGYNVTIATQGFYQLVSADGSSAYAYAGSGFYLHGRRTHGGHGNHFHEVYEWFGRTR